MSRPYPNRRRKRPGRRPPNRYRGGGPPVRPDGFQDLGLRHVYDLILPGIRGGDRRRFFNRAAAGLVVGMGLTVAFIGLGEVGLGGAILAGVVASVLVGRALRKHRFFR